MCSSDLLFLEALLDTSIRKQLQDEQRKQLLDQYDLPAHEQRVLLSAPRGTSLEVLAAYVEASRVRGRAVA